MAAALHWVVIAVLANDHGIGTCGHQHPAPEGERPMIMMDGTILRACRRCGTVLADDFGDAPNAGACQGCADRDHHQLDVAERREYLQDELARRLAEFPRSRMTAEDHADFIRELRKESITPRWIIIEGTIGKNTEISERGTDATENR